VVQLDPLINQRKLIDRSYMSTVLEKVEKEMPKEFNVKNPGFLIIENEKSHPKTSGLKFPLVCKTFQACGSASAHQMGIVFDEESRKAFKPPIIAQEYYNHGATIFKIFVIGDTFKIIRRESLPDLSPNLKSTILFDSQQSISSQKEKFGVQEIKSEMKDPPLNVIDALSKSISKNLGLTLFGFDVITQKETGCHAVIDINYFPGYVGFEDFNATLFKFLLSKLK